MTEPVLFVPGLASDARVFAPQVNALSREHVVQVASLAGEDSIRAMAAQSLSNAPPKFALVGQGMGGVVALEMAHRAPDRVTRLALISTSPLPDSPEAAAAREPVIVKAQSGGLDEAFRSVFHMDTLAEGPVRGPVWALMHKMALELGAEVFVRHQRAMQRRPDTQKVLRVVKMPVLVLAGEADRIVPVQRQQFMAQLVPYAQMKILSGAGHVPSLETPAAMISALETWLTQPMVLR
ncbi:MAG: alpha/beta hydrolase [Rhodobacterales bacterium]|nr:MAG: alpha/beta hydrolase [Rhodobacterales bacterium]PIE09196.1 MAG: alpha/beta hydrolase [Rhodobacterales bacterium]